MSVVSTLTSGLFIVCTCVEEIRTPVYGDICNVCGYNRATHQEGQSHDHPCFYDYDIKEGCATPKECSFPVVGTNISYKVTQKAIKDTDEESARIHAEDFDWCRETILEQQNAYEDALKTHEKPRIIGL